MEDLKILRVAFYIRVSTIEQSSRWYWLEYQRWALDDLIKYKSNQTPKWITDNRWVYLDSWYSWSDLNRPEYKRMIEDAKKWEFDIIAVWKIDRLSRNLSHLLKIFEDLKDYWVWFYSVKENIDFSSAIWKLTFQIFWALAEFEREMIKSRTVEWKIASARSWNFIRGSAPFWYIKGKNENTKWSKLIIQEDEIKVVKNIFSWFVYDDLNYSEIAKKLNEMKVLKWVWWVRKNIEYTKWYETTVKDVLERSVYVWYIKEKIENLDIIIDTPRVISNMLYESAQIKINDIYNQREWWKKKYLLSWKIYDAIERTDKWEMRKFIWVLRTKWWHSYRRDKFVRENWEAVKNREFPGKDLDEFVWEHILNFINKPEKFYKIFKKETTQLNKIDRYRDEKDLLLKKISEEENKKEAIELRELSWRYSEEKADKYLLEADNNIINYNNKIKDIDDKIEKLINLELIKESIDDISSNFYWKLNDLTLDQKRRLVNILVDKILVYYNDESITEVEVIFKFNVDVDKNNDTNIEPKDSTINEKKTLEGLLSWFYGAPSRIWTHGRPRFAA